MAYVLYQEKKCGLLGKGRIFYCLEFRSGRLDQTYFGP